MDSESIRKQAEQALQQADHAETTSEYPRLGRAVYTGLSQALNNLADTVEAPPTEPAAPNTYEERRAARIDRLKARAARLRVEAAQAECRSHDIGRHIPFGQPVLVGHHSERRRRNAINKMHAASRRAYDLRNAAADAERAAEAAEDSTSISSDDPQAITKLRAELAEMEAKRDRMKAANKFAAKGDAEGLKALGYADEVVYRLLNPRESYERKGFQPYQLSNLGANIRRVKQRIGTLEREAARPAETRVELTGPGFRAFEDADDNRMCFQFDGKPDERTRAELKSRGFKWSPRRGLWVRQLSENARWAARHAAEAINKLAK